MISIVHKYMVQILLQNPGGKSVFLGGPIESPLEPTGVKVLWSLKC